MKVTTLENSLFSLGTWGTQNQLSPVTNIDACYIQWDPAYQTPLNRWHPWCNETPDCISIHFNAPWTADTTPHNGQFLWSQLDANNTVEPPLFGLRTYGHLLLPGTIFGHTKFLSLIIRTSHVPVTSMRSRQLLPVLSLMPRPHPAHARRRDLVSQVQILELQKCGAANQIAEQHLLE